MRLLLQVTSPSNGGELSALRSGSLLLANWPDAHWVRGIVFFGCGRKKVHAKNATNLEPALNGSVYILIKLMAAAAQPFMCSCNIRL